MKSGTNWLGSLLSSHSKISVVGEFHWQEMMQQLQLNFRNHPVYSDPNYREFTLTQFETMVKSVIDRAAEPTATVVGERTPHRIAPIILRDASVISIIRDGRDVLISRAFHLHNYPDCHRLFKRIPAMYSDHEKFKNDPWYFRSNPEILLRHEVMVRESVRWWRDHLKEDRKTVEENPDLRVKFVRYEDLHVDTIGERKKLFEFLGVDPKRAANVEGHLKAGFEQEQPTEFFRKGAVGDWKNYFTDQVKDWFKDEGGEELIQQGYEQSLDW